jgi:putative heme-binding domain-containing protein
MMTKLRTTMMAAAATGAVVGGMLLIVQEEHVRTESVSARQAGPPPAARAQSAGSSGDASRGRTLVESSGCFDCHRIGARGSRVGPDLSDIGTRRTPESLEKALVAPDEEVAFENRSVRLVTRDGATVTGRLLNQDALTVQLMDSKEQLKTYSRANLREYTIIDKGLMPSVQGKLTDHQVADMVAYLASLVRPS